MIRTILLLLAIVGLVAPVMNVNATDVNSDDTMENDVPPNGEGLFCDHPSNPGSCYDRNDNPEEFCVKYPEYDVFCDLIDICDENGSIRPEDPYCNN
jgi:hypothetical protein